MALGRAERFYECYGEPVSIRNLSGSDRDCILWKGNPAWQKQSPYFITDGAQARPYISKWVGKKIIFNMAHKARAGKIYLTDEERAGITIEGPFAVISPEIKDGASPNKQWPVERWEKVIQGFPIPVYQLGPPGTKIITGARHYPTETMRAVAAVVERCSLVLTTEGGMHHMAASFSKPAVVIFGSFTPPSVLGYDFHENISVETEHGWCGDWKPCQHCKNAMDSITVDMVKERAYKILGV